MLKANLGEMDFFGRLARWQEASRAAKLFDEVINRPITASPVVFQSRLYQTLIDYLLQWLKLPRSLGAMEWEWRALYQFGQEADPFYFTETSIHRLLGQWPTLDSGHGHILASALSGYLHLRRDGFPQSNPSPLLTNAESHKWAQIFPAEWCWMSMDILRKMGKLAMSSRVGYRAYLRYVEGTFEPELTASALRRWQAECWRRGYSDDGPTGEALAPYRANFVAAVFGGQFAMLGIQGPCGDIPDCEACPLKPDCRWYGQPVEERPGALEIQALVRRGQVEALGTDQLLQGLFDLPENDRAAVYRKLAGTSLRELAAKSHRELGVWCGEHGLTPEKLQLTFELCKRFNEERLTTGSPFHTPWDIFKHFRMRLRDLKQEQFIAVFLDNKKRYLSDRVITQGTLDASPVHPREVFNAAIRENASAILIVHNHPSGDPNPSRDDIQVTRQLIKAGATVGIPVLDHIIIADDRYTSLMELGALDG